MDERPAGPFAREGNKKWHDLEKWERKRHVMSSLCPWSFSCRPLPVNIEAESRQLQDKKEERMERTREVIYVQYNRLVL